MFLRRIEINVVGYCFFSGVLAVRASTEQSKAASLATSVEAASPRPGRPYQHGWLFWCLRPGRRVISVTLTSSLERTVLQSRSTDHSI
eukprot:2085115-Amphidinium_carterae.1